MNTARFGWLLTLLLSLVVACGGGGGQKQASFPEAKPAPASMKDIPVLLQVNATAASEGRSDAEMASKAIQDALAGAGYALLHNEREPHDAVMTLELVVAKRQQAFVMKRNGKTVDGLTAQLGLTLAADGQPVHAARREFNFTQGDMATKMAELQALVHEINGAPAVQQLGDRLAKARGEREAEEANMKHAEWREKYADACEKADKRRACDGLERWMERNKGNEEQQALLDEGTQILEVAKPKLEEMSDDSLWLDAREAACLERATDSACRGVKNYLRKRPKGKHAADAQAALDNLKKKAVARADGRERDEKNREVARKNAAASAADARRAKQERKESRAMCLANCESRCDSLSDKGKARACSGNCQATCP